ncbi:hypothetical protein GCK72_008197 [Caenorhabditis remanei]|uniref:Uncharacterized protein n=1 Tax=Caenorhabditis remanei TaxID=31234 RepID=A0A6A5H0C9_CAERE|nr:hypothetical protein GCK72_008197 [Caenorhabditis remanei]KAF1759952.1 hypothetical protein GCK72_008197 [Caenorhabditis remanei]
MMSLAQSDEGQSGEEPPEGAWKDDRSEEEERVQQDDSLEIMDDNSTRLNNNQTIYSPENSEPEYKFDILETYLPLFIFVLDLPTEDREALRNYMTEKTYEKLKYVIDAKVRMNREGEESVLGKINETLVQSINNLEKFDEVTVDVVNGYHNASVYNAIRSVWLKQLRPFLPLIDQLAIQQYFAQRKLSESEKMSIWARIWENLNVWMYGKKKLIECYAMEPKCVRHAVESLNFEQRIDLDLAAYENKFDNVDGIIREKLDENRKSNELDEWLHRNRPPMALQAILDERSDIEEEALQRLRDNRVLSSLKHYYKAVIESRSHEEQEEIRHFFEIMNDTFARCFDPLRGQYHDF